MFTHGSGHRPHTVLLNGRGGKAGARVRGQGAKLLVTTTEGLITINPDTIYRAEPTDSSKKGQSGIAGFLDLTNYGSLFRLEVAEDVAYKDSQNAIQLKDIAFVTTGHNKKALIIDITDISAPTIIKEIDISDAAGSITNVLYNKEHKLLFIIAGGKLYVYELKSLLDSNLQGEPRRIGVYEDEALIYANSITADDKYLYVGSDRLLVIQYDPEWGMELETVDEEFLKEGKLTVNIPASDYYPRLEEKEIWIKVMDSLCDPGIIGSLLGKTKEACLQEYNKSGADPNRPVKVEVMKNHEETKIPQGCEVNGVNADGTYSADGRSDMELNKARAKFKIKCPDTIKDGEIAVVFKRENKQGETWPENSKNLQAKVVFNIRSNANVRFAEVLKGSAVYVYDENTESKTSWSTINQTPTNETRGLDYVQELFNQVVPRKRKGYDNYDSVIPIDNNYKLIEENGIYDNSVYNALFDFKQHFKIRINRKVGSYTLETKYSSDDETSPTFRKLMKDYGKRQVSNPWLIGDNTRDTWRHKVIDGETLAGLNGYQATDMEVTSTTSTLTGNVVVNTGLYELYANVVRPFVGKMIEEGERYAGLRGTPVPTTNWVARTGEGQVARAVCPPNADQMKLTCGSGTPAIQAHGHGMSYSFGGKQDIDTFNSTVSSWKAAPNEIYLLNKNNGVLETDAAFYTRVMQNYLGNIDANSGNIAAGGTKKWAGLKSSKYGEYSTNPNSPYYMKYWAGIDCSGFVQRTVEAAQNLNTIGNIKVTIPSQPTDMNVVQTFINDRVYYINLRNLPDGIRKIHKGDLIEYRSRRGQGGIDHTSAVYSDRPTNCVDKDGKTTCTYEIIHAYGVDEYTNLNERGEPAGDPIFSRKVIKTWQNITATPTGFGRIKLWD